MGLFLQLGLLVLVAWGLWSVCQPRSAFVVRIKDGKPKVAKGTVSQAFLHQIGETCSRHHVKQGVVRGVVKGRSNRPDILRRRSAGLPAAIAQPLDFDRLDHRSRPETTLTESRLTRADRDSTSRMRDLQHHVRDCRQSRSHHYNPSCAHNRSVRSIRQNPRCSDLRE